jgi:hypothetical protein
MSNDLLPYDDLCRLIRGEPIDAVIKPDPQPEQPKRSLLGRMFRAEPKAAKPDMPYAALGKFRKEVSAAVDANAHWLHWAVRGHPPELRQKRPGKI